MIKYKYVLMDFRCVQNDSNVDNEFYRPRNSLLKETHYVRCVELRQCKYRRVLIHQQ